MTTGLPDPAATVVVDIGGTKIMAALASAAIAGKTVTIPTPSECPEEFVCGLVELIRCVHPAPTQVIVANPGAVETGRKQDLESANLAFSRLPLRELLESRLGGAVHLIGDAEAGAIAEFAAGAAAEIGASDGIYFTISTGIGAGLVLDSQLRVRNGVGEIGHTPIGSRQGIRCGCGALDCLETVASGSGVASRATTLAADSPYLSAILAERPISARDVTNAADQGDELAERLLGEAVAALAGVTAALVRALAPAVIVFGGGFAVGGKLRAPLERAVHDLVSPSQLPVMTRFLEAGFGRRSVLAGAALVGGQPQFWATGQVRPLALADSAWGRAVLGGG